MCVSGGGSYDQEGFGIKIGQWIDLKEEFRRKHNCNPLMSIQKWQKFGKCDMKWNWTMQYISIMDQSYAYASGSYQEDGIKIGQWIDFAEGFSFGQQLIFKDEYKNGRKFGNWMFSIEFVQVTLIYNNLSQKCIQQYIKALINPIMYDSGSGSYDEEDKGYKIGHRIDLELNNLQWSI
ncbi:unnamed protein product [Paramecium octaurelia]|uniref:Uncharacterized protein n=1 Tax=Paramecium octaurelia TaxID=43137 RepID=A0A8S1YJX2_PAROT|nr:unnamed protein product [Paramecium octaurelia]